jgi:hypothetical protein
MIYIRKSSGLKFTVIVLGAFLSLASSANGQQSNPCWTKADEDILTWYQTSELQGQLGLQQNDAAELLQIEEQISELSASNPAVDEALRSLKLEEASLNDPTLKKQILKTINQLNALQNAKKSELSLLRDMRNFFKGTIEKSQLMMKPIQDFIDELKARKNYCETKSPPSKQPAPPASNNLPSTAIPGFVKNSAPPAKSTPAPTKAPLPLAGGWAGTYKDAGANTSEGALTTCQAQGSGNTFTFQCNFSNPPNQTDHQGASCTATGNTAKCKFSDGHYHDLDKDQYYGGEETLTLSGNQIRMKVVIEGTVRWVPGLVKNPYSSSHDSGNSLTGTVTRVSK